MSRLAASRTTALVVLVVGVLTLAACSPLRTPGADDPVAGTPTPRATEGSRLPTIVGLRGNAVVEVDPESGEAVTEHPLPSGGDAVDLELVPVRRSAIVTRRTDEGPQLVDVSLVDGSTRVLGPGERPAATADGSRLAFVRAVEGTERRELVATTWEGTEIAVWPIVEAAGEDIAVDAVGWAGTGEDVVVTIALHGGRRVLLLPVDREGTVRGAGEEVPPTSAGAELRAGTFREPHRLTVAEGCCGDARDRWRIVDVVAHTWSTAELLAGLPAAVRHLDWTSDLRHLLVTLDTTPPRVVRWHAGQRHDVTDDLHSAEW